METYTRILDMIILSLLALAVTFSLNNDLITSSHINRAGMLRTTIIGWQSLMLCASFCVFLRFVAQRVR